MKGTQKLFAVLVVVTTAFLLLVGGNSWAKPGELKWRYDSLEGFSPLLAIDNEGNRIIVVTSANSSSTPPEHYWNVVSVDEEGHLNWKRSYHSATNKSEAFVLATDSKGNVIVAGFEEKGSDCYWKIISYSSSGSTNWERSLDGGDKIGFSSPRAIAIDSKDNVIVVGHVYNGSNNDWKVISFSPVGGINWEKSYDGGRGDDQPLAVAIDSKDNAIVVGSEYNGNKFNWKVISYSSFGVVNWEQSYDKGRYAGGVAIDSNDNAVVVGIYSDIPGSDWHIISYSQAGGINWDKTYDAGEGYDQPRALVVDSKDNAVVVGYGWNHNDKDWKIVSFSPSGDINWEDSYDGGYGDDEASAVAINSKDIVVVAGYTFNSHGDEDWRILSFSTADRVLNRWVGSYDGRSDTYNSTYSLSLLKSKGRKSGRVSAMVTPFDDWAETVCIDESSGDVVIAGNIHGGSNALAIDCEGLSPAHISLFVGHVLKPGEVRTVHPAVQTPNPAPNNGTYLGFGDVVANGTHFKVEAAFPKYLKQSDNSTLPVKIFIAAQLPDDYSRLLFFDSSNNVKYQPPDRLSPWKSSVSGGVSATTVFPEIDIHSGLSGIPTGTHYWYTLVVPATVPDDFSGVDWSTTPWEITVNILDVE